MPKYLRSADKIKLNTYNDLFGETVEAENIGDRLVEVPLSELHEFKGHPFQVRDDEEMEKLVESIREYGVLHPGIARPMKKGRGYELIAGHRRKHASEIAGKEKMPVFVRAYDDDEATIIMVDSNLQREQLLISEKAKAYRMKYEAMKHQGKAGGYSLDEIGKENEENRKQVQRILRLSFLNDRLLSLVDKGNLKFRSAVELSFLNEKEQETLADILDVDMTSVSIKTASEMKAESKAGDLTEEKMRLLLFPSDDVTKEKDTHIRIDMKRCRKYFGERSDKEIMEIIYHLIEEWAEDAD